MGERKRLRRGRFRILPLLRTSLIETAQEGAPLRRFPLLENPLRGLWDQVSAPPSRRGENGDKITTLWLPLFRPASHFCQAGGRFYRRGSPPPESFQGDSQGKDSPEGGNVCFADKRGAKSPLRAFFGEKRAAAACGRNRRHGFSTAAPLAGRGVQARPGNGNCGKV